MGRMKSAVDYVSVTGNCIRVDGWAYEKKTDGGIVRPQIQVKDDKGNVIPCEINDVVREDVEHLVERQCIEGELGYHVSWEAEKTVVYQMIFQGESEKRTIPVSMSGMKGSLYTCKKLVKAGEKSVKDVAHSIKRLVGISGDNYKTWEKAHRVKEHEIQAQRETAFEDQVKISIIVPAYRTPEKFLREMIESVRNQSYQNWELCIADGSIDGSIQGILEEYAKKDDRVKYEELKENYGISGNTNAALALATGDYLALLDHDDLLTPDALYEVVKRINETKADVLYTDEDKVTMDLKEYFEPNFKPDFSLDLLRSCNYICHFFVVKNTVFQKVGLFREECNGSQDFDFILRCTSAAERVEHIARILYHWRCHPNSTAGDPRSKMYCYEAGKRSLELDLAAHGIEGTSVAIDSHFGYYRVTYPFDPKAKLAVLILPHGGKEQAARTMESVKANAGEKQIKLIEVVRNEGETVPAACNRLVNGTDADYLLFLQAGMQVEAEETLNVLLGNCARPEVGAVSPTILLNGKFVAHSGMLVGTGGKICTDLFAGRLSYDPGYMGRMIAQQNVRAVSWKGMMVKRRDFLAVGGFEESLQELYWDVDLCLKLQRNEKLIVYTPYTTFEVDRTAIRSESPENASDEAWLRGQWESELAKEDPFYNRNFKAVGKTFLLPRTR